VIKPSHIGAYLQPQSGWWAEGGRYNKDILNGWFTRKPYFKKRIKKEDIMGKDKL